MDINVKKMDINVKKMDIKIDNLEKKMDIKIDNLENKIDNLEFKLERKIDNLSSTVGYLYEMSLAPILHLLDSNLNGLNFERKIITIERSLAKILLAHWEKINPNLKNYSGKHVYPFTDFIEINLYSSKNIYITGGTKHFIIEATTSKLPSLLDLNNFNSYEYENLSQYQKEQIGHLCWKVIQLEFQSKVLKEKNFLNTCKDFYVGFATTAFHNLTVEERNEYIQRTKQLFLIEGMELYNSDLNALSW